MDYMDPEMRTHRQTQTDKDRWECRGEEGMRGCFSWDIILAPRSIKWASKRGCLASVTGTEITWATLSIPLRCRHHEPGGFRSSRPPLSLPHKEGMETFMASRAIWEKWICSDLALSGCFYGCRWTGLIRRASVKSPEAVCKFRCWTASLKLNHKAVYFKLILWY